jgi:hypothetical protein
MLVEHNSVVDPKGSVTALTGEHDMTTHPFYFTRTPRGEVVDVHHHEAEPKRVVGSKRVLASMHQHLEFDPGLPDHVDRDWSIHEIDAVGASFAAYSLRGGRGFLRPNHVLYKRQQYHRSVAVPEGFAYESNTTSTMGPLGMPTHLVQNVHFYPTVSTRARPQNSLCATHAERFATRCYR